MINEKGYFYQKTGLKDLVRRIELKNLRLKIIHTQYFYLHLFYLLEPECSCYPDCTIVNITPDLENPDKKVTKEPNF